MQVDLDSVPKDCNMSPSGYLMREVLHAPRDWLRKVRRASRQLLFRSSIGQDGSLRLRSATFLEAIVNAAPGSRMEAFQRLYPSLLTPSPASSGEICEMNSLAEFESS